MKVLILDDEEARHARLRETYENCDVTSVFLYSEFLHNLSTEKKWDLVHLDHDLGECASETEVWCDGWGNKHQFTGYHAALRIAELPDEALPARVIVHSVNPVGAQQIVECLSRRGIETRWEPFYV